MSSYYNSQKKQNTSISYWFIYVLLPTYFSLNKIEKRTSYSFKRYLEKPFDQKSEFPQYTNNYYLKVTPKIFSFVTHYKDFINQAVHYIDFLYAVKYPVNR